MFHKNISIENKLKLTESPDGQDSAQFPAQINSNNIKSGLSSAEVAKHLEQYGYNELPEKHVNPLFKFLSYFWGPIPWMIEIAAGLLILVHHWVDFAIIGIMLVVNACIGF